MGPAALDDAGVLALEHAQRLLQLFHGRDQRLLQRQHRRDVQRGGKGVVGGLAHVHVVVRVAEGLPGEGVCPVGDDLVDVHVGLGARAGLPDHQGEVLLGGPGDDRELLFRHLPGQQRPVGPGRGQLQDAEGRDDLVRHGLVPDPDGEVFHAALGLGAPEAVGGHRHLAHRIVLQSACHVLSLAFLAFLSYLYFRFRPPSRENRLLFTSSPLRHIIFVLRPWPLRRRHHDA